MDSKRNTVNGGYHHLGAPPSFHWFTTCFLIILLSPLTRSDMSCHEPFSSPSSLIVHLVCGTEHRQSIMRNHIAPDWRPTGLRSYACSSQAGEDDRIPYGLTKANHKGLNQSTVISTKPSHGNYNKKQNTNPQAMLVTKHDGRSPPPPYSSSVCPRFYAQS